MFSFLVMNETLPPPVTSTSPSPLKYLDDHLPPSLFGSPLSGKTSHTHCRPNETMIEETRRSSSDFPRILKIYNSMVGSFLGCHSAMISIRINSSRVRPVLDPGAGFLLPVPCFLRDRLRVPVPRLYEDKFHGSDNPGAPFF